MYTFQRGRLIIFIIAVFRLFSSSSLNIRKISADACFSLLQVFHVELGIPYNSSNRALYLILVGTFF